MSRRSERHHREATRVADTLRREGRAVEADHISRACRSLAGASGTLSILWADNMELREQLRRAGITPRTAQRAGIRIAGAFEIEAREGDGTPPPASPAPSPSSDTPATDSGADSITD